MLKALIKTMKTLLFLRKTKLIVLLSFILVTHPLIAQTISSTEDGGNWNSDTTWVGGVVPSILNDVIIPAGANVTIRSPYTVSPSPGNPALCNSLTIDGTLTMGSGSGGARFLQITASLLINSTGIVTNDGANEHQIALGGDYTNNGAFNSLVGSGSIQLIFNGTGPQLIAGTPISQSFQNLIINKTSGQVSMGGNVATIHASNFTIAGGEFVAPPSFNLTGNFINNGVAEPTFQAGTGTVTFSGVTQSIGGSTPTTFHHVTTSGSTVVTTNRKTTINGNLLIADGTTFNVGGFDLTVNGTTTIGGGSSGILNFTSTTGTKIFAGHIAVSSGAIWENTIGENIFLNGGITNNVNGIFTAGSGTYNFEINSQSIDGTMSMSNIDIKTGIILTNNGTLTVNTSLSGLGGFVQGSNATLNVGGTTTVTSFNAANSGNTVNYIGGAQSVKGVNYVNLGLSGTDLSHVKTLSNGTSSISGNFSISGLTTTTTTTNITIGGNLTLTDGATFTMAGDAVTVTGNTTIGPNSKLIFSSVVGAKTFSGLVTVNGTWDNTAGEDVTIQSGITNNGTCNTGSGILSVTGTFEQGANSVLNLGGTITFTTFTASATNNTVNYTGGAQTVIGVNYVNLGFSGTGAKTLQAGTTTISGSVTLSGSASTSTVGDLTINGNLAISPGTSLTNSHTVNVNGLILGLGSLTQLASATLNVYGDCQLNSIAASAVGNSVNYFSASSAVIPGSYYNLNLNQSSGDAILYGDVSIGGTIALNAGNLDINNHNLTVAATGILSIASPSATSMIITSGTGEVRKVVDAIGSYTFPIGENTGTVEYSPITVNVTSADGFTSAYIGASVTGIKHPDNNSTTDFLTRNWTVSQSGISNCVADINGTYLAADVSGTEANIVAGQLVGTFNQLTNGWEKFLTIGSNTLNITGSTLTSGQTSTFTGISGANPVSVTILGGDGPAVCVGTPVLLDATVTGEGEITYVWTPTAGLSATNIANPSAEPHVTTTYTLTIYDANGASAFDETTITTQQPTVNVNNLEFCNGESGVLTASGADSYAWSPATALSATTGNSVTANPTETITYMVIGTDVNTCSDTARATVTVYPIPAKPTITGSDLNTENPKLTSSSTVGNQWFKNGTSIAGATGQVLNVTADGSYTVQVTTNGCESPLSNAFVIVIVGLDEDNVVRSSRIYPNPATDNIQFDRKGFLPGIEIEVKLYDLTGRLQATKILMDSDAPLDIKGLAKGQHIFVARQNNVVVVQKFIKN